MCVERQLHAQSIVPKQFLACAGYGTYCYIPVAICSLRKVTSIAIAEIEKVLKQAIYKGLKDIK
jgi:hypothetical protein